MSRFARSPVSAVLGPTNTGKTHLAVERLCAHSSGMMGFPLRLLAREVYDRVVAIKGAGQVGLLTGEEKILPADARWLLCTAESMPVDRDAAFVALDEAQLGTDPERGHVFTSRLLHARGREETMILGSASMAPMVRALAPEAEIVSRPRFSNLRYAGAKKLSRLPPRSAIVAFSAEQVYAVAEMLRRTRGGAAIVMGALSPRTRNAQVAMYQAGEVDYLVATDAIGMGLNLDVGHIAFAGLTKFDGKRQRRLSLSEIAQIAGRAGRHQRDGTFGTLAGGADAPAFTDAEIERIEAHRFGTIDHLMWRNTDLDFRSVDALIASLERAPDNPVLRPAPEAIDLAVLKSLASDPAVADLTGDAGSVARLWEACGLPDFRKTGAEFHARLVAQLFGHLATGKGHIPPQLFAAEIARLDDVQGDVDTISGRLASVRTWAYVAHRRDWLADPAHWGAAAAALEEKLSDALHKKLTERFVDRRTTVLMKAMGTDAGWLDVRVDGSGSVTVEDEPIGTLAGFRFTVDPAARLGERKTLLAAAEARLPRELARRAQALAQSPDQAFALACGTGEAIAIHWRGHPVAKVLPGRSLIAPRVALEASAAQLPTDQRRRIEARLKAWLEGYIAQRLAPLIRIAAAAEDPACPPQVRALLAQIAGHGGILTRDAADATLAEIDHPGRKRLHRLGIHIGALDLFHPVLLKPDAVRLRLALDAVRRGALMPPVPMPGLGLLDRPSADLAAAARMAGYRRFGTQMLRIDLAERIVRAAHDARGKARVFEPDLALATSIGVGAETLSRILRATGFRPACPAPGTQWRWQGRPRRKPADRPANPAFAALAQWPRTGG
jgi:ATP-dependent RNA helicase SUPV3L1/SUV3